MSKIDVRATATLIETTNEKGEPSGRQIWVRRLKQSENVRLATAAGLQKGDTAATMRMGQLMAQTAIVDATGLTDINTGEAVAFSTVKHPLLGSIASEAVFDALTEEELDLLADVATAKALTKDQEKN